MFYCLVLIEHKKLSNPWIIGPCALSYPPWESRGAHWALKHINHSTVCMGAIRGIKSTITLVKTLPSFFVRAEMLVIARAVVLDCLQTATEGICQPDDRRRCADVTAYPSVTSPYFMRPFPRRWWWPGAWSVKTSYVLHACCGDAPLTLRSVCGQWPPLLSLFCPPLFPLAISHAHMHGTSEHKVTCMSHDGCEYIWWWTF